MFAISYPIWNIGRTGILEEFLSLGGMHVSIFFSDYRINIGDYWLRPAWKAVHIACDVGNRVHTRNDSDEDVRGYAVSNQ